MKNKLKVGILLSYDYVYALTCIKQIYKFATDIYLAIDKDYLTWAGQPFTIPKAFYDDIVKMDVDKKIKFFRESFYIPEKTSMQNETRERNLLAQAMGEGWQIQIDCDEYLADFTKLQELINRYDYLPNIQHSYQITFRGRMITLFKQTENGFLYINNKEVCPFLYNHRTNYNFGRGNLGNFKVLEYYIIHQSWAREDEQIEKKIKNWGHNKDFDTRKFVDFWKTLNEDNYNDINNFHPIKAEVWDKLHFLPGKNVEEFISNFSNAYPQKINFPLTEMDEVKLKIKHFMPFLR